MNDEVIQIAMDEDTAQAAWHQKVCEEVQRELEEETELSLDDVGRLLDDDEEYQKWLTAQEIANGSPRTTQRTKASLLETLKGKR